MATLFRELDEGDLRNALSVVQALAEESADRRSFVASALEKLTQLVPSDLTTLSLCDLQRGTRTVFGRRGETISEANRGAFNRHFHEHPLVRFHSSSPQGPTQRISDCLRGTDFLNSPVYADYYSRIGIRHVMALPLRIDPHNVISIVFNRSSSDFRNAERAVLEGARPALAAFYRNLVAREEAGVNFACISDLAASGNWQVIRVTSAGRVLDVAAPGLRLLHFFFPPETISRGSWLPVALSEWLLRHRPWGLDRQSKRDRRHFVASRLGVRLTVHLIAGTDDDVGYLLLRGERYAVSAAQLAPLPVAD